MLKAKVFAGLLIASAGMVAIYAIAATIATNMAASFPAPAATRDTRIVAFATAANDAAPAQITNDANCAALTGAKRNLCNAGGGTEQMPARPDARANRKDGIKPPAHAGLYAPGGARIVDVALYRAHRQFPDWKNP